MAIALGASGLNSEAQTNDYAIYVAPRDSTAQKTAAAKANDTTIFAERTLHRALTKAGELLSKPGQHSVRVWVAQGQYKSVADSIFLNGAHGRFDPFVTPLSENSTIDIANNFFLNNIKALKARALFRKARRFRRSIFATIRLC